jgi:hypothetical protein
MNIAAILADQCPLVQCEPETVWKAVGSAEMGEVKLEMNEN